MSRKVFISFLGGTNYRYCDYQKDGKSYGNVRFVQESTLNYLDVNNKWTKDDVALILLTKTAEDNNWVDNGQKDREGNVVCDELTNGTLEGLATRLKPFEIKLEPVRELPEGNDEKEIWEIFERVFKKINDDDELYFDITHGFRYLPMLVMVLCNYSKFLKKVTVKSITYGNFEVARKLRHGLLVDLLPLTKLQDWTYAAGTYLDSGNVDKLTTLCNEETKLVLRESLGKDEGAKKLKSFVSKLSSVVEERRTCRGIDIIESKSLKGLKEAADVLEESTFIKPFNPIFEKIKKSLVSFDESENIRNGLSAAVWCYDNGLYQQSATILQEFVVSFFCMRHGIAIDDEENRELVNKAFNIKAHNTDEDKWNAKDEQKPKIREIISDDYFDNEKLIAYFQNLTEVRNDFNHSGMRSKRVPMKPSNIKENIKKCICGFAVLLFNIKIEKKSCF